MRKSLTSSTPSAGTRLGFNVIAFVYRLVADRYARLRFVRALACFCKARELACILLEGYNSGCDCPHVDLATHAADIGDALLRMVCL